MSTAPPADDPPPGTSRLHGYLARFGFRGGDPAEVPALRIVRVCGSFAQPDTPGALIGAERTSLHATFTGRPGARARFCFELPASDRRRRLDAVHLHGAAGAGVCVEAVAVEQGGAVIAERRALALSGPVALRFEVADKPVVEGAVALWVTVAFGVGGALSVHFESAGVDLLG